MASFTEQMVLHNLCAFNAQLCVKMQNAGLYVSHYRTCVVNLLGVRINVWCISRKKCLFSLPTFHFGNNIMSTCPLSFAPMHAVVSTCRGYLVTCRFVSIHTNQTVLEILFIVRNILITQSLLFMLQHSS